jgi:hypothetical protein
MKKKFIKKWQDFVETSSEFLAENTHKVILLLLIIFY